MNAFLLMTDTGPLVVLTRYASILDNVVVGLLAEKGVGKFIAYEIPIALVRQRYGLHFDIVEGGLTETDELRVLDEDGERIFRLFRFDELCPAISYEASGYVQSGAPVDGRPRSSDRSLADFRKDIAKFSKRIEERASKLKSNGQFQGAQIKTENELKEQERRFRHRVEDAARAGNALDLLKAELGRDRQSLFDNLIRFEQDIDVQFERHTDDVDQGRTSASIR